MNRSWSLEKNRFALWRGAGHGRSQIPSTDIMFWMKPRPIKQQPADRFEIVRTVGLALPDVEAATKYDGTPVLRLGGCFMAGMATHRSAAADTLVLGAIHDE